MQLLLDLTSHLFISLVAQPEAQGALQWLSDLTRSQAVTLWGAGFSRANEINVVKLFLDGRVAMLSAYWFSEPTFTQALGRVPQFNLALAEPPRGPRQAASFLDQFPGAYHLSKTARVSDDAWRFLRWWTSAATQRRFQAESNSLEWFPLPPARRSLAGEFVERYGAATLAALAYARPLPLHPRWYDLVHVYERGLLPMWKGEQAVAAATAAITSEQNVILAEWQQKQGAP